mgnify:CR=1 FL=1
MPKGDPAGYLPTVKKARKKKGSTSVPMKGSMGGLLGVTAKKPEPDSNLRTKQRSARIARLTGKPI